MNSTIHLAFLKATDNKFGSMHQIEYNCDFERLKNLFPDKLPWSTYYKSVSWSRVWKNCVAPLSW